MISIGLLHSVNKLLDIVQTSPLNGEQLTQSRSFFLSSIDDIINLAQRSGWLHYKEDGSFIITERGKDIICSTSYEDRLRKLLKDIIISDEPAWSKKISHGRNEFQRYAPKEITQCFEEAGLFSLKINDEIITWWDELSIVSRIIRNTEALHTGRIGEKLTIHYERERTGEIPKWQAFESNYSGYDILSRISYEDDTPLQIEVKASKLRMKDAKIILTINEWENANLAISFKCYIWILNTIPLLAILDLHDIGENIPNNAGDGRWESVSIPMLAFRDKFKPTKINEAKIY